MNEPPGSLRGEERMELWGPVARLQSELTLAYANLTAVQERCTELLLEVRRLRALALNDCQRLSDE